VTETDAPTESYFRNLVTVDKRDSATNDREVISVRLVPSSWKAPNGIG
jgi:hypothetical protein